MEATGFYKHPRLIDLFGRSRLFETVRHLRGSGHFPAGHTHVSPREAWTLVYALCSANPIPSAPDHAEAVHRLVSASGRKWLDEISFLHQFPAELVEINNVVIYSDVPAVAIVKDEHYEWYADGKVKFKDVARQSIISKNFIVWLHTRLINTKVKGRQLV